tara:strand:+ start:186 stop:575 length:390 start_codon:yes stop_codon:yes gene_type:complete
MKEFTAVVSHTDGLITKFQDFDTEDEAKAHVATHGGKVVADLDEDLAYWDVSSDAAKDTDQLAADILAGKWAAIRTQRDVLMAQSDWTVATDTPLSDSVKAKWVKYRKALRDLPASESDPDDITWPDAP